MIAMAVLIGVCAGLSGCKKAVRWDDGAGAPPQRTSGEKNQRSSRGNPPFYEVFGRRYHVMDSGVGFTERGIASWYGKKFHGRPTSSGVIYNMHAMTAAHKTLPLPSEVRVRNLKNGRSVIVTVNDRGPFIEGRIIDLSFAAATRLDMIQDGTVLVEIEVLAGRTSNRDGNASALAVTATNAPEPRNAESINVGMYLQVGAFGDRTNAQQLLNRLHGNGFQNASIRADTAGDPALFRVRVGPIADVAQYDLLVEKMARLEIVNTHLVTESGNAPGS